MKNESDEIFNAYMGSLIVEKKETEKKSEKKPEKETDVKGKKDKKKGKSEKQKRFLSRFEKKIVKESVIAENHSNLSPDILEMTVNDLIETIKRKDLELYHSLERILSLCADSIDLDDVDDMGDDMEEHPENKSIFDDMRKNVVDDDFFNNR